MKPQLRLAERFGLSRTRFQGLRRVTLILTALSVGPLPSMAEEGLHPQLLVRYAMRPAEFEDYNAYVRDVLTGRLRFDRYFMTPEDPPGPAPVPCNARRIGITFIVDRPDLESHSRLRMGWLWTHSAARLDCRECVGERNVRFGARQGRVVGGMGLELLKANRHDGTYRIEVTIDGERRLAAEFVRSGCDAAVQTAGAE
ncbi:MAG: hypothetical protein KF911_01880 [Pseudomonadales bacterium]|nr:hypothetical protein [Pseudomonadales bacterium]